MVYFSSSSTLVALTGELVVQVKLMEAKHYKYAMTDEKMLALENLHSDMIVMIGDSDLYGPYSSMRLANQALHICVLQHLVLLA